MKQFLVLSFLFVAAIVNLSMDAYAQAKPLAPGNQASIEDLVDRYFVSLNEPDDKKRRDIIKEVWAEKGTFVVVPFIEGEGLAAIDEVTKGGITKFPNSTVRRTSKIEGSGIYYRWTFALSRNDGTPLSSGTDYAIIVDGKLRSVIGYLDWF